MDISQIRYANFEALFKKFKDDVYRQDPSARERGMLKRFAEKLDISQAYASHIHTSIKPIGTPMARKFEQQLKLPAGWMDQTHDKTARAPEQVDQTSALTTDEQSFLESAMALYRADPAAAQAALMKAMMEKIKRG